MKSMTRVNMMPFLTLKTQIQIQKGLFETPQKIRDRQPTLQNPIVSGEL